MFSEAEKRFNIDFTKAKIQSFVQACIRHAVVMKVFYKWIKQTCKLNSSNNFTPWDFCVGNRSEGFTCNEMKEIAFGNLYELYQFVMVQPDSPPPLCAVVFPKIYLLGEALVFCDLILS